MTRTLSVRVEVEVDVESEVVLDAVRTLLAGLAADAIRAGTTYPVIHAATVLRRE